MATQFGIVFALTFAQLLCFFFSAVDCDRQTPTIVGNSKAVTNKQQQSLVHEELVATPNWPSIGKNDINGPHFGFKDDNLIITNVQQSDLQSGSRVGGHLATTDKRLESTKRQTRRLIRRAAVGEGRRKSPRVQLAQRPKTTSTTTTTTTTTTIPPASTEAADSESEEDADETAGDGKSKPSIDESEYEEEEEAEEESSSKATPKLTTTAPRLTTIRSKGAAGKKGRKASEAPSASGKKSSNETSDSSAESVANKSQLMSGNKKRPLVALPFIKPKNASICTPEAYLEFPRDLIGNKWRARGLVLIHLVVVCYMFYSLAIVCERYFMPSLEEFAQRLQLSEDVAGATLMSAGSSAPELFTAILGVFVAKGDVGTGAIVGSAVFNILFVIGICAFVSTTSAQLNWWPVLRDSVYYTFTILVLILFIYDERITMLESFTMIALYGVYILIMANNETLKEKVTQLIQSHPITAKIISSAVSVDGPDDVFGSSVSSDQRGFLAKNGHGKKQNYQTTSMIDHQTGSNKTVEEDSIFLAALLIIVRHKRLFRSQSRFQSAARYIITIRQHRFQQKQQKSIKCSDEVNYFGPESEPFKSGGSVNNQKERMEAYAQSASVSKSKFSIVSKDDYEFWNRPPEEGENYYIWLAKIPVNYVLHYTIPDCALYPDKYIYTFIISILWTAFFSYIMVWMVTLIGYTFGIPDSVMGVTFLAAGTSVPDCYSSVHAARNGMADMAVSNSIGSNVFDILIGLSLPWFIQTAIYPGVVATINSRGVIYSVMLLFLSLIITIYLMNKYDWTLEPRLGLALLIAYGLFIVLTCMLEFNLFGHVNPPPCPVVG